MLRRAALAAPILAFSAALASASSAPAVRAFRLEDDPGGAAARDQVAFCLAAGFDAAWLDCPGDRQRQGERDPGGASPDLGLLALASGLRARGARVIVAMDPCADAGGGFVFSDRAAERRIERLFRHLHRDAGVRDFVLSFAGRPTQLTDPRDVGRYGRSAAPAHVDLARRVSRHLGRDDRLWLRAAAYSDAQLDGASGGYAASLLAGLGRLPSRVGIVWSGIAPISPEVTLASIRASRARLGGREILFDDRFGAFTGGPDAIADYLGPLRGRDPSLGEEVAIYVASPLSEGALSRLPLLTVAAFLADPAGYDPDRAWREAIDTLAGDSRPAREALHTQTLEWRGWEGGQRFRPWDPVDPESAAAGLDDPALVATWEWVVSRYPERMEALSALADRAFRDALLDVMARRLAIARAIPAAVEYRARRSAGRTDLEPILETLRQERGRLAAGSSALRAFDRFLAAAGIEGVAPPAVPEGR